MFNKLYGHYKTVWSMEMRMSQRDLSYDDAFAKAQQSEEWI